jgi:two-component system OmpR family sensor kinase
VNPQIQVLVASDGGGFGETITRSLADGYGFEVRHATSAESALETLAEAEIDCIVALTELPDRDGLAFLEAVREREDVPFIFIAGRGDHTTVSEALDDEFADYLLELELAEDEQYGRLAGRIESLVARHRTRKQCERQSERIESLASVVSHDLRNPLNVALSSVELLEEESESPHLDRVRRSLSRICDIIDDLVTLARGSDPVANPSTVDLETMATDAWTDIDPGDVTLNVGVDRHVEADADRLRTLLGHLLENAAEHGEGVSTVTVGTTPDGFFVADDGDGIPDDYRDDIFQAGFTTARAGTGLGLNIAREIASAHGWNLEVGESESGGGRFDIVGVTDA